MTRIFTLFLLLTGLISTVAAQSVIYKEDFENAGFTFEKFFITSMDGGIPSDTNTWGIFADTAWILANPENDGNHVALATSAYSPAVAANDWLITPAITLGPSSKLKWNAKSLFGGNPENYSVYISTSNQSVSGCEFNGSIFTINGESDSEFAEHIIDLAQSGYKNQKIYIGFNLNTTSGGGFLALDNIEVSDDSLTGPVALSFTVDMTDFDALLSADSGFVDIAGNFNNWDGSDYRLTMSETDSNIYSISIPGFFVGNELEFRFRINGSWDADTVEFANGGLNRVWIIEKDRYFYSAKYNRQGVVFGTDDDDFIKELTIFPNPVKDKIIIRGLKNIAIVNLYDTRGVLILQQQPSGDSELKLDLTGITKGIYILSFTDNKGKKAIRKIIKQ